MNPVIAGGIAGILIAVAFVLILRSLLAPRVPAVSPEWLRRFDISRYRPMERLLSEDDYSFLASQRGYEPSLASNLRAQRRKILKAYLRLVKADFDRLHHVARLLVIYSEQDRPELAGLLVRQRIRFVKSFTLVQLRLAIPFLMPIRTSDLRMLIESLEWMRAQVPSVVPAA